jgi:hypothetical protein
MTKGSIGLFQPEEVEVRIVVRLDTILAFVSGDEDGYLKIPKSTFLALLYNTIKNPESDANHNIAQILFNLSRGNKTGGNVAFLV